MSAQTAYGPFAFLKQLTETPGVSGREERVRELVRRATEGFWDETRVDPMGSLICLKRATRPPKAGGDGPGRPLRVMLACHMDEIGFYVRHVDEDGFVRVQNVGGFDTRNLFARRVVVHGREDLLGVMNPAGKPVHVASDEEKKKIPEIHEFAIDLFRPADAVRRLVNIGDPVTLVQTTELVGDAITGKALDNRMAVWVGINAVRKAYGLEYLMPLGAAGANGEPAAAPPGKAAAPVKSRRTPAPEPGPQARGGKKKAARGGAGRKPATGSPYDIYFVACVQEEVGLRGALTAAYGIDPDVGIAIDVTLACDTPGVGKDLAITECGKGVAIKVMDSASISHRGLFDEFVTLAQQRRIPFQRELLPRGGTDAGAVQKARAGIKTITISVPTQYIHTVTESVNRKDALAAVDLVAAWLSGGS